MTRTPETPKTVYAVNLLSMLPGIDPAEFEHFSTTVDRPRCLAYSDVVKQFDAYRVVGQPDGANVDIVEVMKIEDWQRWEEIRDNEPSLRPVMEGFNKLVDPTTARTFFVTPVNGVEEQ